MPCLIRLAALDVQAQAKERDDKLQLLDYELKLAKEDLAEMHKKLEQVIFIDIKT